MRYQIVCTKCKSVYESDSRNFRCDECGGILEVQYDYKTLKLGKNFWGKKIAQSKYSPFFPIESRLFSLGEGGTKLIKVENKDIGSTRTKLYLKIETTNPTRSFKDRGSSVEITKALELGYRKVVCASTGNMGLSIATYAKRKGIAATVFISKGGNKEKMKDIVRAGSKLVKVDGDFNKATSLAEDYGRRNDAMVCGDYHYRKEGQKSVIFEILEQLKFNVPDYVFVQVGNATLIAAMHKGLKELRMLRKIKRMPRLIAVQASKCDPLVKACKNHTEVKRVGGRTIADAIEVGYPTFGSEGLAAINETHGSATDVSDMEIVDCQKTLKNSFGISSEPGGAAGFAGFIKMYRRNKKMFTNKAVAAVVSGNNENST